MSSGMNANPIAMVLKSHFFSTSGKLSSPVKISASLNPLNSDKNVTIGSVIKNLNGRQRMSMDSLKSRRAQKELPRISMGL